MKTLDKHILREWFKVFAVCFSLTVGLLVLQDMYNELQDILRLGASFSEVGYYYLTLIPSFMPMIVPLALMVSLVFSLGQLHRSNEITAMRAAGLSIFKITRTLWLSSAILTGTLVYLNAYWIPESIEQSRNFYQNLELRQSITDNTKSDSAITYSLAFDNRSSGRLWFINRYSALTSKAHGVSVYFIQEDGSEYQRISAKEAYYDKNQSRWTFLEGKLITFDDEASPIEMQPFESKEFSHIKESPELMLMLNKNAHELSYREMSVLRHTLTEGQHPMLHVFKMNQYKTLASPFSCVIITAIVIPFIVSGVRTNPMIGLSKIIGLVFAYHFLTIIFSLLGKQDIIPVIIAAWAPNITMLFVATIFYKKLH